MAEDPREVWVDVDVGEQGVSSWHSDPQPTAVSCSGGVRSSLIVCLSFQAFPAWLTSLSIMRIALSRRRMSSLSMVVAVASSNSSFDTVSSSWPGPAFAGSQ